MSWSPNAPKIAPTYNRYMSANAEWRPTQKQRNVPKKSTTRAAKLNMFVNVNNTQSGKMTQIKGNKRTTSKFHQANPTIAFGRADQLPLWPCATWCGKKTSMACWNNNAIRAYTTKSPVHISANNNTGTYQTNEYPPSSVWSEVNNNMPVSSNTHQNANSGVTPSAASYQSGNDPHISASLNTGVVKKKISNCSMGDVHIIVIDGVL